MRDKLGPGTLLSYCMNVYPGSSASAVRKNLRRFAKSLKRHFPHENAIGVGLWYPGQAEAGSWGKRVLHKLAFDTERLEETIIKRLAETIDKQGLIAATVNAFPFFDFHDDVVKHAVYTPGWAENARHQQSYNAAFLMAYHLAPDDLPISISTVPIGWPSKRAGCDVLETASKELRGTGEWLRYSFGDGNVTIDLEPEPGCILDTADDVIAFFEEHLPDKIHRKHIGVCHDVCHAAVMFEDQREVLRRYAEAGIRVNKVQISSALDVDVRTIGVETAIEHLRPFAEPRYLHQTSFMTGDQFELIEDLPEAIGRLEAGETPDRLRVHFHVPVYLDSIGPLGTTNDQIAEAIAAAREYHDTKHFEVETYAWGVLPDELKRDTLAKGIADELKWVLDTCGHIS